MSDVETLEKQEIIGQLFYGLTGRPNHDTSTGLVSGLFQ